MELTFMDVLTLHVYSVLASLGFVVVVFGLLFALAYICALIELAQERRTRRRKESRNA